MNNYKNSVMVALLPIVADWAKTPLPHLTLVYVGETENLRPTDFNELAKTAASIAMVHRPIMLRTINHHIFGDYPDKVDVFTLRANPELMDMRKRLAIWDASKFPFKPHVTVGPEGSFVEGMEIPPAIAFDRLLVAWGEEHITFWLKP